MKKKQTTLRRKLILLLTLFLVIQLGTFSLLFLRGGVLSTARSNALNTLDSLTTNRSFSLSSDMSGRWGKLGETQTQLANIIQTQLEARGVDSRQLLTDSELAQEVVAQCADSIVTLLRQNAVTDAYLVLDAPGSDFPGAGKAGFALRDYDPQSYISQNTDLLMECGLPTLARSLDIPLDSGWSALFSPAEGEDGLFFSWPLDAIREGQIPHVVGRDCYWSSTQQFGKQMITCSAPIVLSDGTVVGVVGIGILADHISSLFHYEELDAGRQGAYVLAISTDQGASYQPLVTAGSAFSAFFRAGDSLRPAAEEEGQFSFPSTIHPGTRVAAAIQPLDISSAGDMQEDGRLRVLIGMMEENLLFAPVRSLSQALVLSVLVAFVICLAGVLVGSRFITKPITQLVDTLSRHDATTPIRLPAVRIREIDTLSAAIEDQSRAAIDAASRNSQVIAMTGLPLGVFDYVQGGQSVFVSRQLFSLLGWGDEPPGDGDTFVPMEQFQAWWELSQRSYLTDATNQIFRLSLETGERYVQLFYRKEGARMLGVYQDVTRTIEDRHKIEYERDYDVLTNLLNRRAFDHHLEALFSQPEKLKIAALLMFDLDNMKYTNDTFGHDGGDRYLQAFARGLEAFREFPSVIGRRSGDEFTVFLYGFDTQAEIRTVVNQVGHSLSRLSILFPGKASIRVRTSGGIAWYPLHSTDYAELLRMADFAMYDIKHTVKGVIREFDLGEYKKRGIFLYGQDALNRLIDDRMVRYAFQPIVSARDGLILGYELLMRPQLPELANLGDLLKLAQSQSKLYQLEQLTWFESLATCSHYVQTGQLSPESLLFINSIGSQCLTTQDIDHLEAKFPSLLSKVVAEITEVDEISFPYTDFKRDCMERWGALIALDDYGTGFSSESVLMRIRPNVVKIDLSIIRDVDTDTDRQTLIRNLLTFAKRRDMKVLAEGVETREELAALIALGVDYLQGFYIARPNFVPQSIDPDVAADIVQLAHQAPEGD